MRMILAAAFVLAAVPSLAFAQQKSPPACAAISYRPLPTGLGDGTQQAGTYSSRFARINLMAEVQGGEARNYFITINEERAQPLQGDIPASLQPCLKSKNIALPIQRQGDQCTGSRFRVVLANAEKQRYAMLFGLQGDQWQLCSASTMTSKPPAKPR